MDIEITMLGTFSVALGRSVVPPGAWTRRGAASLVKLLALAEGRTDAPRAGDGRALAGPARRGGRATTAQGGALRAPGARADARGPPAASTSWVLLLPDTAVSVRRRGVRAPGPGRRCVRVAVRGRGGAGRRTAARCCPRTSTSRGRPTGANRRRAARDLLRLAGRWEDLVRGDPDRRGRPRRAGPRATPTAATYARRCGSWSGWTRRCVASSGTVPAEASDAAGRARRPGRVVRRPPGREPVRLVGRRPVADTLRVTSTGRTRATAARCC